YSTVSWGRSRDIAVAFFFQAEDGIRDFHVTGVQTCALPISWRRRGARSCPTCAYRPGRSSAPTSSRRGSATSTSAATSWSPRARDRKSVVEGKRVDVGGRRGRGHTTHTRHGQSRTPAPVHTV